MTRTFFATLVYELDATTDADTRKLLRAELVGRRWQDRSDGKLMPSNALWMRRSAGDDETTTDLGTDGRAALGDLEVAVDSVRRRRRTFRLRRGGRRHARSVADLCFIRLTKRSRSFHAAD